MADQPVFFDASGRRAVRASVVGWTAAVVSLVLGAAFAASLVVAPQVTVASSRASDRGRPVLEKKALARPVIARSGLAPGRKPGARSAHAATRTRTAQPSHTRVVVAAEAPTGPATSIRSIRIGKPQRGCSPACATEARLVDADGSPCKELVEPQDASDRDC
jgi:hypothetical protein